MIIFYYVFILVFCLSMGFAFGVLNVIVGCFVCLVLNF